jgi:disulfide bond formation protein DsbB
MRRTLSPRFPFALSLFLGIGLVAAAVFLAQFLRLAACPLCILQRMLYLALSGAAVIGLLTVKNRFLSALAALLIAAFSATGVFVAGYQTYLQRFAQDTQCSGAMAWWEVLVDWAGERIPLLFRASGLCSEPGWKFIGLSIAEWSLLAFCFLTLLSLFALLRRQRM